MRFRTLLLPVAVLGMLAACGDNLATSDSVAPSSAGSVAPSTTAAGAIAKPEVKLPSAIPTSLVVTDLTEGTGDAAANGDTVIVHYVGVRSADGKEFDNSYDRGSPLPVTLGVGQVIAGWDQGLVGIKSGGRRQLDIPTDLAYGDAPPATDVIQPGDALTFVIDAVTIIRKPDPADVPTISVPPTANQAEQTFTDLIVGDGAGIQPGQTVAVQLLAFSAADGKLLDSSWDQGTPLSFVPGAGRLPPGVEKAVEGMKVGGRRQVDIPFAEAWGAAGNTDLGLPASTDLIMVLDLVAVY
jgi:peptidylprolyl isomerase